MSPPHIFCFVFIAILHVLDPFEQYSTMCLSLWDSHWSNIYMMYIIPMLYVYMFIHTCHSSTIYRICVAANNRCDRCRCDDIYRSHMAIVVYICNIYIYMFIFVAGKFPVNRNEIWFGGCVSFIIWSCKWYSNLRHLKKIYILSTFANTDLSVQWYYGRLFQCVFVYLGRGIWPLLLIEF